MWFNTPRDMSKMPADLFAHSDVEDDVVTMDSETVFNEDSNQSIGDDWTLAEIGPWKDDIGDDASTSEGSEDSSNKDNDDKKDASKATSHEDSDEASEGSEEAGEEAGDEPEDDGGDVEQDEDGGEPDDIDSDDIEPDDSDDDIDDDIDDGTDDASDIQEGGAPARAGFVEDVHTMYKSLSPRSKTCQHVIALSLVTMMCSFLGGVV